MDARRNMNGRHPGGKIAAGGIFLGLILTFTLLFPTGLAAASLVPAEIPAPIYRWHTFQGGAGNDAGLEMDLDPVGNIYIVGQSNQTWNGPEGQSPIHGYNADFDVFVLKLDNSGNYLWHTFYGSALMDQALWACG